MTKKTCRICKAWWPNFFPDWPLETYDLDDEQICLGSETAKLDDRLAHTEADYGCEGWI